MPPPNSLGFVPSKDISLLDIRQSLENVLITVDGITYIPIYGARLLDHQMEGKPAIQNSNSDSSISLRVVARQNTWSRAARRRQARAEATHPSVPGDDPAKIRPALICDIYWGSDVSQVLSKRHNSVLECRWVEGEDRNLFESFWNHVTRKLSTVLGG